MAPPNATQGITQASPILPPRTQSVDQYGSLLVRHTVSDRDTRNDMFNITFEEGDEELGEFPSELRDQLAMHIKAHGPLLLWGVASKDNKPFTHFRTEDGMKLLAAKYRYAKQFEITVIKASPGTSFNNGQAALVTSKVTSSHRLVEGIEYGTFLHYIWRPDRDVREIPPAQMFPRIYKYFKVQKEQLSKRRSKLGADHLDSDDCEFATRSQRRSMAIKLPLEFVNVEGDTSTAFPRYLSEAINCFVEENGNMPDGARKKNNRRRLFLNAGKRIQYRRAVTEEILLADRYECQGRYFDIIHMGKASHASGGRSVLLGNHNQVRRDFTLQNGAVVSVTYYYTWTSHGRSAKPEIEKWTFQNMPQDVKTTHEQFPTRQERQARSHDRDGIRRYGSIDGVDGQYALKLTESTQVRTDQIDSVTSIEPLVFSIESETAEDFEQTDESEVEGAVPKIQTQLSNFKRRRSISSDHFDRRPDDEDTPLRQKRRRHVLMPESTVPVVGLRRQSNGPENLLESVERKPTLNSISKLHKIPESGVESSLDHFFVFKMNVVDEDEYPSKSFKICDDISLLFQHAIQAGIADQTTSLLILQSRRQKWEVVRRDPHDFAEVLACLMASGASQRVVVTPH